MCGPLVRSHVSEPACSDAGGKYANAENSADIEKLIWSGGKPVPSKTPSLKYLTWKRRIDVFIAIALFLPFLISCALIWLANQLWSPGPLFFRQSRVGKAGSIFKIIKFRTMTEAAENSDCRITPVGKILRRWRIDELPQLINVWRGEMSWIGPRPEAKQLSKLYRNKIPNYDLRHVLLPGVTGWAQVKQGHVTELSEIKKKLSFDLYFVKNISLQLELRIALHTLYVIAIGYGAK